MNQMIEQGVYFLVPHGYRIEEAVRQGIWASAIVSIVIGVLLCFFGYRLFRIFAGLSGLVAGVGIGSVIILSFGLLGTTTRIAVLLGCGLVLCILCAAVRRIGAFFLTLVYGMVTAGTIMSAIERWLGVKGDWEIQILIAAGIVTVLAILAAIFLAPMVMTITGICGGLITGMSCVFLAEKFLGVNVQPILGCILGAILAILGIWVQFILHSRRVGRYEKIYAKKVKEEESRELEVEQARKLLEEEDTEPEEREDEIVLLEGEDLEEKTTWSEKEEKTGGKNSPDDEEADEEFVIFDLDD